MLANSSGELLEDDKDFANDLLNYEKELLYRVYGLVADSLQDTDMQIGLRKIL